MKKINRNAATKNVSFEQLLLVTISLWSVTEFAIEVLNVNILALDNVDEISENIRQSDECQHVIIIHNPWRRNRKRQRKKA